MSELDSLLVTFQTQLSDVMETVVKTAMFEVTRLVEDGFLEEVKRRNQEVESLRMQLQWVERKLRKEDSRNGKCVSDGVQLSSDTAEEPVDGPEQGCGVKKEADSAKQRDRSHTEDSLAAATQAAEDSETTLCIIINPQITETEDLLPRVDVKEEEVNKPLCSSSDLGEWRGITKGNPVPESSNSCNTTEAQSRQTPENNKELLGSVVKPVITQVSTACFTEEQQDTHMADDPSNEEDDGWPGLTVPPAERLQNHIHATEKDCNPDKATGPLIEGEHNLSDSVTADISALIAPFRDQVSSSASLQTRLMSTDVLGVTIKQEVTDGFDECVDSELRKKTVASFSSLVRQQRSSPGALGHNPISHKAKVQEMIKPHSKMGTGLRLQTAIHQLSRPIRKSNHALSNSSTTALSAAHAQAGNFRSVNKIPPMSKAAPPPPLSLSVQRVHLGDKQAAAQNRNVAPWVSIKTQHNAHHSNASPHLDSHPVGPRQLQRCGQCGKCFPHPSNLKAHLQTHTGERPFCCSLCGRSFTKLSNLKAHRRVHTGERPYCCLACGKRFTQKCNLKRHQRIHLDL